MNRSARWTTRLVAACLAFAGFMQSAQATLVTTEQVAAAEGVRSATSARARVAALTDAEVAVLAHTLETAPAGAADVLGVLLTVFLVLLVTDILGLTKVFPFTRPIR